MLAIFCGLSLGGRGRGDVDIEPDDRDDDDHSLSDPPVNFKVGLKAAYRALKGTLVNVRKHFFGLFLIVYAKIVFRQRFLEELVAIDVGSNPNILGRQLETNNNNFEQYLDFFRSRE